MAKNKNRSTRTGRVAAAVAALAATVALPVGAGVAHAADPGPFLPPGVVRLHDGEPCPYATLCLYRDYGNRGPAYGIGAGYRVNLRHLPMPGTRNGTAADAVSSWVNNAHAPALLIDEDEEHARPLFPGQSLQEPPATNDTVDVVHWL